MMIVVGNDDGYENLPYLIMSRFVNTFIKLSLTFINIIKSINQQKHQHQNLMSIIIIL